MGVKIIPLLSLKNIELEDLSGKTLAIDASNHIYQFLSNIRTRDGTPLMDSKGNITSHLIGLFGRSANLIQKGIKLVYVFDGEAPKLKSIERAKRKEIKIEAEKKYQEAVKRKDTDEMKKYASRTSRMTPEMIQSAKELVSAMGIPYVQAPSEGEAQAAYMVQKGDAYAVASQDGDSLVFGANKLIRNISIAGKKKKLGQLSYETVKPELIDLDENLKNMGISREQLVCLAMLVGTDFNTGGIKGLGPKKAISLVKKIKDPETLFNEVKWDEHFDYGWKEVYDLMTSMKVEKNYNLKWESPNEQSMKKILCDKHDFSEERVEKTISDLQNGRQKQQQKGLGDFV